MKCQVLFSLKTKTMKKYSRLSSAAVMIGTLQVNQGFVESYSKHIIK